MVLIVYGSVRVKYGADGANGEQMSYILFAVAASALAVTTSLLVSHLHYSTDRPPTDESTEYELMCLTCSSPTTYTPFRRLE